jgi:hypothetical protein
VVFVLVLLAAAYGYNRAGQTGIVAALVAGLACGGPALLALVVTVWFAGGPNAVAGTLGGTLLRTGGPLVGLVLSRALSPELEDAGLVMMVLGIYLGVLPTETILAVKLSNAASAAAKSKSMSKQQAVDEMNV